jgi:DNA (cytosine-5)-methyltransferase 1
MSSASARTAPPHGERLRIEGWTQSGDSEWAAVGAAPAADPRRLTLMRQDSCDSAGFVASLGSRCLRRLVTLEAVAAEPCSCDRCGLDRAFLRTGVRPTAPSRKKHVVTAVDLFAGCGGLTCGLEEAARRAGRQLDVSLAVDVEAKIARVYKQNFPRARVLAADVASLFPGAPGTPSGVGEVRLAELAASPDFLVAGPPCQGHSDLNNHTRRADPRNALYLRVARAAEVLEPRVVIVENVPAVQHDRDDVVGVTVLALEKLGYSVASGVIDLAHVGVPQHRRRFVLLASVDDRVDPFALLDEISQAWPEHGPRTVDWAIRDLEATPSTAAIDLPSTISAENRRRIEYLFEQSCFDLPDSERPTCHRDKAHSYRSVYGRLRWERPAQTITTGFGSMGQGRYVHPSRPRTLTPHEAARLQTFPDWFDWGSTARTTLSTIIGNAVPPLLTLHLGERILTAQGRGAG